MAAAKLLRSASHLRRSPMPQVDPSNTNGCEGTLTHSINEAEPANTATSSTSPGGPTTFDPPPTDAIPAHLHDGARSPAGLDHPADIGIGDDSGSGAARALPGTDNPSVSPAPLGISSTGAPVPSAVQLTSQEKHEDETMELTATRTRTPAAGERLHHEDTSSPLRDGLRARGGLDIPATTAAALQPAGDEFQGRALGKGADAARVGSILGGGELLDDDDYVSTGTPAGTTSG